MKSPLWLFPLLVSLAVSLPVFADCQPDDIANLPGKYQIKVTGNPMLPLSVKDKQLETSVLGKFYSTFSSNYQPKGLILKGAGVYGIDGVGETWRDEPAYYYYLEMGYFPYRCKNGMVDTEVKGDESGTWIYFSVNMTWGVTVKAHGPYKSIPVLPRQENGVYFFDYGVDGLTDPPARPNQKTVVWKYPSFKGVRWEKARMLTYDGQLPFSMVTRREYLEYAKGWLDADIQKDRDLFAREVERKYPIRPREVQQAELDQTVAKWRAAKFSEAYIQRQIKDTLSDEERRAQAEQKVGMTSRKGLEYVNRVLAESSDEELKKTAKLRFPDQIPWDFKAFIDDQEYDGSYLVRMKPDYFNGAPGKATPRIITVYFENEVPGNKVLGPAANASLEAIDYQVLKALLDKGRRRTVLLTRLL